MVNLIEKQSAGLFSGEQLAVRLFTPVRSARGKEISLTAVSDKSAALDLPPFFTRKRWTKKPVLSLAGLQTLISPTNTDLFYYNTKMDFFIKTKADLLTDFDECAILK